MLWHAKKGAHTLMWPDKRTWNKDLTMSSMPSRNLRLPLGKRLQAIPGCSLQAAFVVCLMTIPLYGQEEVPLTPQERSRIVSLVENAPEVKHIESSRTNPRRVLVSVSAVRSKVGDATRRIATVLQYEYEGGKTIRTVVDVDNAQVKDVKQFTAYPTPFAPEERLEAASLAARKLPEIRELLEQQPSAPYDIMPTAISERTSPKYGHRIARVIFYRTTNGRKVPIQVDVDLTDRSATLDQSKAHIARPAGDCVQVVEQAFPVTAPAAEQKTAWRVECAVQKWGAGDMLFIKHADFRREPGGPWIRVINECSLVEMFVPYNAGSPRYYDISTISGILLKLDANDLGPRCLGPGRLLCDDRVAVELHDAQNLWIDHYLPADKHSRRAEELQIWGVRTAGNYVYLILYTFRSDGSISLRVGATAHNHSDSEDDTVSHLHLACWRLQVAVGDVHSTDVQLVRYRSSAAQGPVATTVVESFNNGQEGGVAWVPEEHTRLRFQSNFLVNNHNPPHPASYDLVSLRHGNSRTYGTNEEWTHRDLWVTRATKADGSAWTSVTELPECLTNPRGLQGQEVFTWIISGLVHRPRDEDFGPTGTLASQGVAITAWSGVDLHPRNFLAETPLHP
jgi:Cu2+-containing amine oxidase